MPLWHDEGDLPIPDFPRYGGTQRQGHCRGSGPIETGTLDRFAGTDDARAGFLATIPLERAGTPDLIARVIMFAMFAASMGPRI